jgi:LAO/AO transport system kinase
MKRKKAPKKSARPVQNLELPTWQSKATLARLLSRIEARDLTLRKTLLPALAKASGNARTVGITGPPGVGKSTMIASLVGHLRKAGKTVAVLAVDPSSPFTGGALLGDRVRMQEYALDAGVFIRSSGTRGHTGGVALSTRECLMALDAAGFDVVLVESAGVGQTEWDIRKLVQTTVVLLGPESGDGIQLMKAGLMEIADVFVVNKADLPGSDRLLAELRAWVEGGAGGGHWIPPALPVQAQAGRGMEELWKALETHAKFLTESPTGRDRQRDARRLELLEILEERLAERLSILWKSAKARKVAADLTDRVIDPYAAADRLERLLPRT